ncbi:GNAT family N-acetyltransferase [Desulfovibrio sp. OttesenSCG-928-I05]|nr:GNAT family N-acetyltransferase [Desulfovibrio sp. OttesenSCG-928-I05]
MRYTCIRAEYTHLPGIHAVMRCVEAGMDDPSLFVPDDLDFLTRHIADEGVTVIALHGGAVCAFLVVDFPGESEKNLGNDLGWSPDACRASVHMDSVCVLPEHRGHGLQKMLLQKGEELAAGLGYTSFLATVHPDNAASLKSFLALGYSIGTTKEKYGGLMRHVLWKAVDR